MSLGSILSVARTALGAQQAVIQTAGHNIANVQTEGFSRQRVELAPNNAQRWSYGSVGTGVVIDNVRRARDELLDVGVRQEAGGEAAAGTRKELLSAVEGVLGEPSETGLASAMDAFWSSWSDLATMPASQAARHVVVQRAGAAATTLNTFDARLSELRTQTTLRLDNTLDEANGLATQIAQLNGRIVAVEAGGSREASDLRDQRDLAIDKLAKFGDVHALPRADGSVQVTFGTHTLVDGITAKQLVRTSDPFGNVALAFADAPGRPLQPLGGSTQAMVEFLNRDLRGTQDQLDAVANALARTVNAVHGQGRDAAGTAPPDFFVNKATGAFDAAASPFAVVPADGAVTARTIGVNAALVAEPGRVATSSDTTRPADNDVALALAGLRTTATAVVGGAATPTAFVLPDRTGVPGALLPATAPITFADFYRATASGLAVRVQDADADATVHATLAEQARGRRDAVTGVNVDEELTTLMRAQQAYAAAAKIVSAADEMMKTVLGMI